MDGRSTSQVKVHSTLTVVSSRPVGPGIARRLSPLDCAMQMHSCHVVFYYRNNPLGSFELDPLRVSLSEVLSVFPLATGRLKRTGEDGGDWEVKCNDAGVRVLRAKVGVSMDEWLTSADGVAAEEDLAVWEDLPDDPHIWSPFRIQLNEFEGGGLAIGISCTHMIADLTSLAILFKSWTEVHRKKPIEFPPSFSESTALFSLPANDSERFGYGGSCCGSGLQKVKMVTSTIQFPEQVLGPALEGLHGEIPGVTPFDFLSAIFWAGITRIKTQTSSIRNHVMSIAMDDRKSVKNTSPLSYFGNSVHFSALQSNYENLTGDLQDTVKLVHRHVSSIMEEQDGLSRKSDPSSALEMPRRMYGEELTCVNMEHLVVKDKSRDTSVLYEAGFDEGERPFHVSCGIRNVGGEGLIIIVPGEGLARTVHVTLPEEQMAKLLRDDAISELKQTLLLSS